MQRRECREATGKPFSTWCGLTPTERLHFTVSVARTAVQDCHSKQWVESINLLSQSLGPVSERNTKELTILRLKEANLVLNKPTVPVILALAYSDKLEERRSDGYY